MQTSPWIPKSHPTKPCICDSHRRSALLYFTVEERVCLKKVLCRGDGCRFIRALKGHMREPIENRSWVFAGMTRIINRHDSIQSRFDSTNVELEFYCTQGKALRSNSELTCRRVTQSVPVDRSSYRSWGLYSYSTLRGNNKIGHHILNVFGHATTIVKTCDIKISWFPSSLDARSVSPDVARQLMLHQLNRM